MGKICVKCGYERQPDETAPDYECPKCGVVYAKVEASLSPSPPLVTPDAPSIRSEEGESSAIQRFLRSRLGKFLLTVVFVVVVIAIYIDQKSNREIGRTKDAFDLLLFDSQSARFKDISVRGWNNAEGKKVFIVCGFVNSKNKMGAYVGYKKFISVNADKVYLSTEDDQGFHVLKRDGKSSHCWE